MIDFEQVNVSWEIDTLYVSKGSLIIPKRYESNSFWGLDY